MNSSHPCPQLTVHCLTIWCVNEEEITLPLHARTHARTRAHTHTHTHTHTDTHPSQSERFKVNTSRHMFHLQQNEGRK